MAENCDPHSEMCGKSQRAPERKLFPFRCSACLWDLSNPRYEVAHFLRGLLLHLPCGVGAAGDPASQENFNCISGESSHANSTNFDCFRYYIRSCKQKVGGRGKRKSPLLKSGDFLIAVCITVWWVWLCPESRLLVRSVLLRSFCRFQ